MKTGGLELWYSIFTKISCVHLPINIICIRVKRPQRLQSVSNVLQLGRAVFRNANPAIKQSKCYSLMYGNKDFNSIHRDNKVKKLRLRART
jgi:hypothetical protein